MSDAKTATNDMRKDILTIMPDNEPLKQEQQQQQQQPRTKIVHDPVYSPADLQITWNTQRFLVKELVMTDRIGATKWSTFYVTLHGGQQSFRLTTMNFQLKYEITRGSGWFNIDEVGHRVNSIKKFVIVEKGQTVRIQNDSETEPIEYNFDFPGRLDIRRVIEDDKL